VAKGLRSEIFHEVIVLGERECEVKSWECLKGVLARTVKWCCGDTLMGKFGAWMRDLKAVREKRIREIGGEEAGGGSEGWRSGVDSGWTYHLSPFKSLL
jgi:hypothetical protein